ncbi:MAG: hypothetical protein LBK61_04325 [Spirochaetaceae bacterium]|nr:hypothetical protein [Spirochaetaceae bacterium]
MSNVLRAPVRYRILLLIVAGIFLLFSCDTIADDSDNSGGGGGGSEPVPGPEPEPEKSPVYEVSLDDSDNGSVTLTGLSPDNEVYLVKLNPSGFQRSASVMPTSPVPGINGIRVPSGTVTIDGETFIRYEMQWQINLPPQSQSLLPINRNVASDYVTAKVGETKEFEETNATLIKIGEYCKIWVGDGYFDETSSDTNDNKVNQTQINDLAAKFDEIYDLETNLLGYEHGGGPDGNGGTDGDLRIQILVYKMGSGVLGSFYAADELEGYNNNAEIFYLNSRYLDQSPEDIYSTLIHEFNHMINFNVKCMEGQWGYDNWNTGGWYTEMLSMLAEDVIGPLVGITSDNDAHVIRSHIPTWLNTYADYSVMQWGDKYEYYPSNYAFGAYLVRNFGGPQLLSRIAKSPKGGRDSLDESLRALNGSNIDTEYALTRFAEVLVYSGQNKPVGVYSFDNTVTGRIGDVDYTFDSFDIWTKWSGPKVSPYEEGVPNNITPYTIQMFSHNDWKNKSEVTVNVSKGNLDVRYFVMVR